jgi:hypothetical protein
MRSDIKTGVSAEGHQSAPADMRARAGYGKGAPAPAPGSQPWADRGAAAAARPTDQAG